MRPKRSNEGFTLIELLVAVALLGILLTLVFSTMTQGVQLQTRTETQVSLDSNLRRLSQIVTQDLRNASYGMVTSTPYATGATSISVALASDNAVHPVIGPATSFQTAQNTQALLPSGAAWPANASFALVNAPGSRATILKLSTGFTAGGAVTLQHAGQANTLCPSTGNFVQRVSLVGYSYDAARKVVFRTTQDVGDATELPLAFNVTAFSLSYISQTGTAYSSPDALPANEQLSRIALSVSMEGRTSQGTLQRRLDSVVQLPALFTLSANPIRYVSPGSAVTCP